MDEPDTDKIEAIHERDIPFPIESASWDKYVAPQLQDGLKRYLVLGTPGGGFLRTFLTGDMQKALWKADLSNREPMVIGGLLIFLAVYTSPKAWGSEDTVTRWERYDGALGLKLINFSQAAKVLGYKPAGMNKETSDA